MLSRLKAHRAPLLLPRLPLCASRGSSRGEDVKGGPEERGSRRESVFIAGMTVVALVQTRLVAREREREEFLWRSAGKMV